MNTFLTASPTPDHFSGQALTSMIVIAFLCTVIPFLFLAYYRSKTKAQVSSFFVGMAFYLLFAMMAVGLFNMIMFRGFSLLSVLNRSNHPVYYAIYGAVVAGLFEETGKYVGLRVWMKSRPGKQSAFLFGVGHGTFEAIAYGSSLYMGNIIIAFMVNAFGVDGYFEKAEISEHLIPSQRQAIYELMAITPLENAADGVERMLALVFQASLTIFIFLAISNQKLKCLFPIAVALHIIGYIPTNLTQVGILHGIYTNLILTGAVVVFTASYAYRMFHQEAVS